MNKILVIDDDSAINELIKVNLELTGYKVIQAFDGTNTLYLYMMLVSLCFAAYCVCFVIRTPWYLSVFF